MTKEEKAQALEELQKAMERLESLPKPKPSALPYTDSTIWHKMPSKTKEEMRAEINDNIKEILEAMERRERMEKEEPAKEPQETEFIQI